MDATCLVPSREWEVIKDSKSPVGCGTDRELGCICFFSMGGREWESPSMTLNNAEANGNSK